MDALMKRLNLKELNQGVSFGKGNWLGETGAPTLPSINPTNGEILAEVLMATPDSYDRAVDAAATAFSDWRTTPAPIRGQVVRDLGNALRDVKEPLGDLVSLEMGKIRAEGHGEVQEMIDVCDFAVGLSRQ